MTQKLTVLWWRIATGDTVFGGAPKGDNAEGSAVNRVKSVGAVPPSSIEDRNIKQQLIHSR